MIRSLTNNSFHEKALNFTVISYIVYTCAYLSEPTSSYFLPLLCFMAQRIKSYIPANFNNEQFGINSLQIRVWAGMWMLDGVAHGSFLMKCPSITFSVLMVIHFFPSEGATVVSLQKGFWKMSVDHKSKCNDFNYIHINPAR